METEVVDNSLAQRFEIYVDEDLAGFGEYHVYDNEIAFLHTEVYPEFQGRGLAGMLTRHGLDDAQARGRTVLPYCSYTRGWISKHPDYVGLVPETKRAQFDLTSGVVD